MNPTRTTDTTELPCGDNETFRGIDAPSSPFGSAAVESAITDGDPGHQTAP
jgi:hypothetical protein